MSMILQNSTNDFDLVSGRYVIDAKSIMGIFSLDLSKPIDLSIHAEDDLDEILETLKTVPDLKPQINIDLSETCRTSACRIPGPECRSCPGRTAEVFFYALRSLLNFQHFCGLNGRFQPAHQFFPFSF